VEKEILAAAIVTIEEQFDAARDAGIVAGARGWHPGVLGIIASRIARRYHRPAIVIGFDEKGVGKGSGRSIDGLNLVDALTRCASRDCGIEKFGGHEMAAGLALHEENFTKFAEAFCSTARELLSEEALQRSLRLDHELPFTNIDVEFLHWHELLQPFGNGNPQPLFFARAVEPVAPPRVANEKHLVFRLRQGDRSRRAVYFDSATNEIPAPPWDVAFRIGADEYDGETLVGMRIEGLRAAEQA
jgi:single-stranded-DNA-specific exonuclease